MASPVPQLHVLTDKQVINAARRWNRLSPLYVIYYDPDLDPEPWNKTIPKIKAKSETESNAHADTGAQDEDKESDGDSDDGYETAEESFEDKIQTPELQVLARPRVIRNRNRK